MNTGFIVIFIVILFGHERECFDHLMESKCNPTEEQMELVKNGVFYCLKHIRDVCREKYKNDTDMQYLLSIFNLSRVSLKHKMRLTKSVYSLPKALINIESIYSSKRTFICKRVARHFHAKYILSPPTFLYEERSKYVERSKKRIFYSLSKYSSSFQAKAALCTRPVILERYWLDHATFLIAKKYEHSPAIPPADSTVYNWPVDLLKPNIVFFINGSRSMQDIGYDYNNFTDRFSNVLRRMKGVKIVEINPNRNAEYIIQEIIKYIEDRRETDFKNLLTYSQNRTKSYRSHL